MQIIKDKTIDFARLPTCTQLNNKSIYNFLTCQLMSKFKCFCCDVIHKHANNNATEIILPCGCYNNHWRVRVNSHSRSTRALAQSKYTCTISCWKSRLSACSWGGWRRHAVTLPTPCWCSRNRRQVTTMTTTTTSPGYRCCVAATTDVPLRASCP